jgi:predicted permease
MKGKRGQAMATVLLKASSFLIVIFLGYVLKRIGFFSPSDHVLISKIVMNVTLPAAVITAFANFRNDPALYVLVGLGLAVNLFMIGLGYLASRRKDSKTKALFMLNYPGYNIGTFTMPFVQSFLGPFGVIATCMFDTGNAVMCTGGSYAIASGVISGNRKFSFAELANKLVRSVPFDSYMIMLAISAIGIKIPGQVTTITSTIASANGFCAMLMIGMMIEIRLDSKYLRVVASVLVPRLLVAGFLSAIFYLVSPFSLEIRQVLAIVVFAPISALGPVFTEKCGGDSSLSGFANSVSVFISVAVITALIVAMGIQI